MTARVELPEWIDEREVVCCYCKHWCAEGGAAWGTCMKYAEQVFGRRRENPPYKEVVQWCGQFLTHEDDDCEDWEYDE